MISVSLFVIISLLLCIIEAKPLEDIQVFGPMDLHNDAMDLFMKMRRENPNINLDSDGEFLTKAKESAIKRTMAKPDEEVVSMKSILYDNVPVLGSYDIQIPQLPSPESKDGFLISAMNDNSAQSQLVIKDSSFAMAKSFFEDVGLGAISRTGALPMGGNGEWIKYAESKIKRDNHLDYQSLLWEMGSEIVEARQKDIGGINVTNENILLENMEKWFKENGGKISFIKPNVSEDGFRLFATEGINSGESVISVPMKLILCHQTARGISIHQKGRNLGEELQKTFEKNEVWGLSIFLLHEYYKEINGKGSKWGPFLRTLRMRNPSTESLQALKGTIASDLYRQWMKSSDSFMWWTVGADGPCSPVTGICRVKPLDRSGDSRFNIHQIRWAYWVIKQNAVRVRHATTGYEFLALIPYYNMLEKNLDANGKFSFERDGMFHIRVGKDYDSGNTIKIRPGNFSDSEFFVRYYTTPKGDNYDNIIKLKLPGAIPKGSKFHYCIKGDEMERNSDACKGSFRSDSMFWKSKVLSEWRNTMNLPPRLQELRIWATRLHLYGGQDEIKLINSANTMLAGLPIPVDQMPAEEQLMLLGIAKDTDEAALMVHGPAEDRPLPHLYAASDPEEDPDAKRAMEQLAYFALQVQNVLNSGNILLNATQQVLNHTKNFFLHGVLPAAGLDELDEFLLKKIGMISHCGFEEDMRIVKNNISDQLLCGMRVHLMNDTEMDVFCPAEVRVWQENCLDVEFENFTAISYNNEMNVINSLRNSLFGLISSYPTTILEDKEILQDNNSDFGEIYINAIRLRIREKELLMNALDFLETREQMVHNGTIVFQLDKKAREREESTKRMLEYEKFLEDIEKRAQQRNIIASLEVNLGEDRPKLNLTLEEGISLSEAVSAFCASNNISSSNIQLLEKSLKARVINPPPLELILGVVVPSAHRRILGIAKGTNITIETHVFCSKYNITSKQDCKDLETRVMSLLDVDYHRNMLLSIPIDSPDGRMIQLVLYEGQQHDIVQFVSDFLEYHHLSSNSLEVIGNEILKRLPPVALQIPISMSSKRQVAIRFSLKENITNTIAAFTNYYEIDSSVKIEILRRARSGMAPGTYLV